MKNNIMDDENKTPKDAQNFIAPTDTQNDDEIKHLDTEGVDISVEEMRRRSDEFNKKSKEANNEKEKRWYKIRAQVELIIDGLGKGIDEGIKEGVTAFMALDFPTYQSCDGHGSSGPWIRVYADAPDGWKESDEKKKEWREANHKEKVKMEQLLQEFYTDREVSDEVRLVLDPIGIFEAFNLQNADYEELRETLKQEKQFSERVKIFKDEMDAFVEFLKEKYFNEDK